MKKILLIAAIITTSATASERDFHISGGTSTLENSTQPIYRVGFGVKTDQTNGLMVGVSLDFSTEKTAQKQVYNYGGDLKLGLDIGNISVYGIGALLSQSYKNSSSYGYGGGGGIGYKISDHFATAIEYKSLLMTPKSLINYDFSSTDLKIKYIF